MLSKLRNQTKGFTIIEVLIVLAIAGLIMLIVFLAVPALQRNSRNTQRKADVANVLGGLAEYSANKNGSVPGSWNATNKEFLATGTSAAGSGVVVKTGFYQGAEIILAASNTALAGINANNLYVNTGARCNAAADNVGGAGASTRNVAIVYSIETSGGTTAVCQEG